jgi:hypothetical protein
LITRRGRTGFTPSNVDEVRLRFERILARSKDKFAVLFQATDETDEVDEDDDELDADAQPRIKAKRTRVNPDRAQPPRARVAADSRTTRESRRALRLAEGYLRSWERALKEDERRREADRRAPPGVS